MHPFPGAFTLLLLFRIQFVQRFYKCSILCIRQSVQLPKVVLDVFCILIKGQCIPHVSQYVLHCGRGSGSHPCKQQHISPVVDAPAIPLQVALFYR